MKFLQTLLIILVVYVSVRLLWRAFGKQILAWMGKKAMEKVQKSFESRMQGSQDQAQDPTFRNTTITSKGKPNFTEKKKVGEYVDFEEID